MIHKQATPESAGPMERADLPSIATEAGVGGIGRRDFVLAIVECVPVKIVACCFVGT